MVRLDKHSNTLSLWHGKAGPARAARALGYHPESPAERQERIQPGVAVVKAVRLAHSHSDSGKVKDVHVEDQLRAGGAVQRRSHLAVIVERVRRDPFDI